MNHLYINHTPEVYWFEYGGNKIGRLYLEGSQAEEFPKWRLIAKFRLEFPSHFAIVYAQAEYGFFLLGGSSNNCLQFVNKNIVVRQSMPEKSFFAAVYLKGRLYTFGGYDNFEKLQLKTCEVFDIAKNEWTLRPGYQLNEARSQASACIFEDQTIFVFGGYNKETGTLSSIEKVDLKQSTVSLIDIRMPCPLRRFSSIKISTTKILLIGGVARMNKESDAVFCFDLEKEYSIEKLDKIDKAGVVDYPVLVDAIGNLHLLLENASGTAPPTHVIYSFLEYS